MATRRSLVCAAALLALVAPASAQNDANYPNRVIRIVVGFAAGGGNDIFARLIGAKLQELLGQSVIIENKPGAASRLANEYAANQPADGYTLLVAASGGMSIASAIYPKLGYHPTKSFVPLTMIANFPLILAIAEDHPAKNVQELVAWMKANPDKSNYATSSPAFTIATELFKLKTGAPGQAMGASTPWKNEFGLGFGLGKPKKSAVPHRRAHCGRTHKRKPITEACRRGCPLTTTRLSPGARLGAPPNSFVISSGPIWCPVPRRETHLDRNGCNKSTGGTNFQQV